MNPNTETLLSHLSKVRNNGGGRYNACCPAHNDRSPSLSIRETDDGRILLHCFAGCEVAAIVAAVGMKLEDLFPPRKEEGYKRERQPFNPNDVLRCIRREALIVGIVGNDMLRGQFSEEDMPRLRKAVALIEEACTLAGIV